MKNALYILIAAVFFAACSNTPETNVSVRECAPMPEGRASACACAMGGNAYVFSGRTAGKKYLNDLWQYAPRTDTWTNLGKGPMAARVNATIAAYDGKLYAGLGYSATHAYRDSAYQRDWWEYTPETNQWRRLANFPTANTVAPVSFAKDGCVYVLYGFGYGFTRDIWRYEIATDKWTMIDDDWRRAKSNFGGRGAWLGGLLYYGTGYNTSNLRDWWATDVVSNHWEQKASIPGKGREFAACAASGEYVYLFGGRHFAGDMTGGEIFETYMRYTPEKDRWEWCGAMPCGRAENQIAFTIDGKAYFGLGEDENGNILNGLYRVEE